jgi:hypothetical protein
MCGATSADVFRNTDIYVVVPCNDVKNSLLTLHKFPVPLGPFSLLNSERGPERQGFSAIERRNFPSVSLFFPMNREFDAETGSSQTASATIQSQAGTQLSDARATFIKDMEQHFVCCDLYLITHGNGGVASDFHKNRLSCSSAAVNISCFAQTLDDLHAGCDTVISQCAMLRSETDI